ncbi:MAG: hypothetical protein ABJQ71_12840 [Roseibium sp.]
MTRPNSNHVQAFWQKEFLPDVRAFLANVGTDDDPSDCAETPRKRDRGSVPNINPASKPQMSILEAFEELDPDEKQTIVEHLNQIVGRKS